jgi:hypothetical protein
MYLHASLLLAITICSSSTSAQDQAFYVWSASGYSYLYGADLGRSSIRNLGEIRGPNPLGSATGLAWRTPARELWTYDNSGDEIGVVDPVAMTFTSRSIAAAGNSETTTDLAWHPATDRLVILKHDSNSRRRMLTTFSPVTGTYATIASWDTPAGQSGLDDFTIDSAGNYWFLGGAPTGLYLLEPGASAPRWFVTLSQSACHLTIDRGSGIFYVFAGAGQSNLGVLDPATGRVELRVPLFSCGGGFEIIEGACRPSVGRFGSGCAGSGGYTPQLDISGCYNPGGFVHLGIGSAPSGGIALLLFGLTPASFPVGNGCSLLIAPVFQAPQIALPLFGSGGAGRGFTSIGLSIPAEVLVSPLVAQAFILDSQALAGFTLTNGVRLD